MTLNSDCTLSQFEQLHIAHLVDHANWFFTEYHIVFFQVVANELCTWTTLQLLQLFVDLFHLFVFEDSILGYTFYSKTMTMTMTHSNEVSTRCQPCPADSNGEVVTSVKNVCWTVADLHIAQAVRSIPVKRQVGTRTLLKRRRNWILEFVCGSHTLKGGEGHLSQQRNHVT